MSLYFSQSFRLTSALLVASFLVFSPLSAVAVDQKARLGLWVEAEGKNQPFNDMKGFETYLDLAGRHQITDVYCQVYRGGRSWYPSMLADDTPYRNAKAAGFDPIGDSIRFGREKGIRVHAWINLLRITSNREAPLLKVLGDEVALVDNYGNSLLDYDSEGRPPGKIGEHFKLGTPGIWLDPSFEKLRNYLVQTIEDVIRAYPDIDGIHLDMARTPYAIPIRPSSSFFGVGYGYADSAIEQYLRDNGEKITPQKLQKKPKGDAWDSWRRAQVTLLIFEIKEMMNRVAPDKELSAAVLAWPDRAYINSYQDWRGWMTAGVLDTVVPMAYTRDSKHFTHLSKHARTFRGTGQVLMGLGAWLMLDKQNRMVNQAKVALNDGNDGVVLFSYSNLLNKRGEELLKKVDKVIP